VAYFLSSRFIDERIATTLREVLALRERVAVLTQDEQRLTEERAQLFKDQERIRSNIESLKSGASQRELAERFVAKLSEQENRLDAIGAELEKLSKERKEANEEVNHRLQSLSYTAELGS
jgi:chromosome segregation ATPase